MTIGEIKNQPEFDERATNVTNKICPGLVEIIVDTTDSSITIERNHDDLGRPPALGQYSRQSRCSAGSDNCNAGRNNQCSRNPAQQNGRQNGRQPNWGDQDDARLPPLRLAFRDSSLAQPARPAQPSRIPVPCPYQPEQPRRQDRPVDLYVGSRLPVPNRPGGAPTRIPRRNACVAQPPRPCASAAVPADRRGTYDVQPPPCGDQNSRRCTYTVQPERRDTYDVQRPCAALQSSRRSSCGVAGPSNVTGSFTMTGTIRLDGFPGLSPAPRDRSSSCGRSNNTNAAINDFLDNQLNSDMVAPRSMAVPGQPYVRIDESAGTATPERWRQMMDNRSSIGSQPMGILSPTYDSYRGSRDTSADSSRLNRWSSSDRESRPFGLNDSFNMNGASSCDRPSRARSAAPDCGPSVHRNRCRRDTFDRNTR